VTKKQRNGIVMMGETKMPRDLATEDEALKKSLARDNT